MAMQDAPTTNATMRRSDVRIALLLMRTTGMGNGPTDCRPNLLGVFPERARRMVWLASAPFGSALSELCIAQFNVKNSGDGVDVDDVAILQQSDRPTHGGLGADMADAEAAGGAGEPAVRNQGDLAAHALPGQCCGGLQHFAHAGTAPRPLVADDDDLAFSVGALLDGL